MIHSLQACGDEHWGDGPYNFTSIMPSITYLAKSFWISAIFTFLSYYPGQGGDIANIVNYGILQACTLLSASLVQQGGPSYLH